MKFKIGDKVKIKPNHKISQPHKYSYDAIYDIVKIIDEYIKLKQTNEIFLDVYFVLYEEKSIGFIIE